MPTRVLLLGKIIPPFFSGTGPAFPDYDLSSIDDKQVKGVLFTLGIHDLFSVPPSKTPMFHAITDDRQPTHRFVIGRYVGHPREQDNGFVLWGWRRSHHSFADVEQYASGIIGQNVTSIRKMRKSGDAS